MHSKGIGKRTSNSSQVRAHPGMADYYNEDSSRTSNDVESASSYSNSSSDIDSVPLKKSKIFDNNQSYDWGKTLADSNFRAAPVSCFKHAPVSYLWENVTLGMKVEVENLDVDQSSYQTAFWVASVMEIQGYKVLLRFEGFGSDDSRDFWVNLCSEDVHHVGWCATKGKPLIPPRSISTKFSDWRDFLVKRLTGARTLPQNFQAKVAAGLKSKYDVGAHLEVVDKNRISQLRLARVSKVVGKRLHVNYFDTTEDGGFWCHEDSPLIHPTGWAASVGHDILAPPSYQPETSKNAFRFQSFDSVNLVAGMKLEAIDPLNLSTICAATIKKVLQYGFVMIRIDCYEDDSSSSDWFCYHITSPYVFPCGFAGKHGLSLVPPVGYAKGSFDWDNYFRSTGSQPVPLTSLQQDQLRHDFKMGMKLEAADLMDPRLICVGTVSCVVGRLLKIHFDGWEEEYDQWLDAASPDIYPVGWCELVGHKLEAPRATAATSNSSSRLKKATKPRKKHTVKTAKGKVSLSNITKSSGKQASNLLDLPAIANAQFEAKRSGIFDSDSGKTEAIRGSTRVIPKLTACPSISEMDEVEPHLWTPIEVEKFLQVNDFGSYSSSFVRQGIDGTKLMSLTKDQIISLVDMKVGPGLKIVDLVSQLTRLVQAARVRNAALCK